MPLVLSGVYGAWNAIRYGYGVRFVIPSVLMAFVGCGSILFHGTLQYGGQALDELSVSTRSRGRKKREDRCSAAAAV